MERNSKYDNLKAFLIFTVVFAHAMEFIYGIEGVYGVIRSVIYSFHMPAFVLLSGYFSQYTKKSLSFITVSYLSTYLFFNLLIILTFIPGSVASPIDFLYPQIIYWYILCLWYWRISLPALSRIKFIIPISILFCLYIGCVAEADRFLAISRAICFLPFFLVGFNFPMQKIERLNKWAVSLLLCICVSVTAAANHFGIIPVKMYEYIQSYSSTGVDDMSGILMRCFMMLISFSIIICLVVLSPSHHSRLSLLGQNSLMIYLLHIFPILFIGNYCHVDFGNPAINIAFCAVLAFALCLVLSIPIITNAYNSIINKLARVLTVQS